MERRSVLGALAAGPAIPGMAAQTAGSAAPGGKIGGSTLVKLRDRYKYDLFEDYLPFVDKHVIDHELGGFMCATDRDGTNLNKNKRTWYEGRGIWVHSFLYNHFGKDPRQLETARKSVEFILKTLPQGDVTWPDGFTREGRPLGGPAPEIYGDLFVAEGLDEYARATGERKYHELAKDLIRKCVRIFDRPDYRPDIGQTYLGPGAPLLPGARIQGVWMVLTNILTSMLEAQPDAEMEKLAARCGDAIMNRHYQPEFGLNAELLKHDMSRAPAPYDQLVYTGHAIETMWMVVYEAARLKNRKLFDEAARRFQHHVEVATDRVYGGVFRCLTNVDENVWKTDKVLWAQEEVLVGALFIVEHTGAAWARDLFARQYAYVMDKYPLKKHGFALWINQGDRKVTFEPHYNRVENFHHPRHLMLNLLCLERMIERGGKVSGLFA